MKRVSLLLGSIFLISVFVLIFFSKNERNFHEKFGVTNIFQIVSNQPIMAAEHFKKFAIESLTIRLIRTHIDELHATSHKYTFDINGRLTRRTMTSHRQSIDKVARDATYEHSADGSIKWVETDYVRSPHVSRSGECKLNTASTKYECIGDRYDLRYSLEQKKASWKVNSFESKRHPDNQQVKTIKESIEWDSELKITKHEGVHLDKTGKIVKHQLSHVEYLSSDMETTNLAYIKKVEGIDKSLFGGAEQCQVIKRNTNGLPLERECTRITYDGWSRPFTQKFTYTYH